MFRSPLRTKLILSHSVVIFAGVFLSAIVGAVLIGQTVIRQAQDKVRLDLNTAHEVYRQECESVRNIVRLVATRYDIRNSLARGNRPELIEELTRIRSEESFDILTLTDSRGTVLVRARNPGLFGDRLHDPVMDRTIGTLKPVVATSIIPAAVLAMESNELALQSLTPIVATPKSRLRNDTAETSGMMIEAAAPLLSPEGSLIGVLIGGRLLNRNFEIVDRVKDIVYRGEQYRGRDIGSTTIFQDDFRISTNVLDDRGQRAVGTRVSQTVYDRVIRQGMPFIDRAFVVNAWYFAAYEPIRDIKGEIIGMLYVGMLEAPSVEVRRRIMLTFFGIALLTMVVLLVSSNFVSAKITRPILDLLTATGRVAQGDLHYRVRPGPDDEIGQLAASFNQMTDDLQRLTDGYQSLNRDLENKVREKTDELQAAQSRLVQSEKLTALGKLAAGIGHEINNPLTSILLNSHLLVEGLDERGEEREELQLIIDETTRCSSIVRGLLEFARQSSPAKSTVDLNFVIGKTLRLFESQAQALRIKIEQRLQSDMSPIYADAGKMAQVISNLSLNAMEAMPSGGTLTVTTIQESVSNAIRLEFRDTGCGIPADVIGSIFDPFFTTKGVKGTGLGLAITYGIIQQHDGTIEVQSQTGRGSVFIVRFPVAAPPPYGE